MLTAEVENEYDKVAEGLLKTMEVEGEIKFSNLTTELLPCGDAYEAVATLTAVTCGDQGAINRVTGVIYVLSLTILFITFFYFSLFNLAFVQDIQVHRMTGDFARRGGGARESDQRNDYVDFGFSGWPAVFMRWVAETGKFMTTAVEKPMLADRAAV